MNLSQLVQPSNKMVQSGFVLCLGARYYSAPIGVRLFGDRADFPFSCSFQFVTTVVAKIFNRARTGCGWHFSNDRGAPWENAGSCSICWSCLLLRSFWMRVRECAPYFF